jgi:hypothetical protein
MFTSMSDEILTAAQVRNSPTGQWPANRFRSFLHAESLIFETFDASPGEEGDML